MVRCRAETRSSEQARSAIGTSRGGLAQGSKHICIHTPHFLASVFVLEKQTHAKRPQSTACCPHLRPEAQWVVCEHTVGVVAVGVPSLASVEADPVIDNTSFSKSTVGSGFYYGITNPALCHPARSAHVETCTRQKTRHGRDTSILGRKNCSSSSKALCWSMTWL